tara:strand:+ start:271 stop:474 length:204 start_codon:yes stop_codon:yes gene_type:complete
MEKRKYVVTYGHTSYYTKEFEASNADEVREMADNDWCEGNISDSLLDWEDTNNGEGFEFIEIEEKTK